MSKKFITTFLSLLIALPLLVMLGVAAYAHAEEAEPFPTTETDGNAHHDYQLFMPFQIDPGGSGMGSSNPVLNGLIRRNGHAYFYINNVRQTGWVRINNLWHYFNPTTARMHFGWLSLNGNHYFLHQTTGVMQTGWVNVDGSGWFFMNNSGRMQTGWRWLRVSNSSSTEDWFYMGSNGRMRTNWVRVRVSNSDPTIDDFYFGSNGRMRRGWQTRNGHQHFLANSGRMQRHWHQAPISNSSSTVAWFYLGDNGQRRYHWQNIRISNSNTTRDHFYLGSNGRMRVGWQQVRISNASSTTDRFHFGSNGRRRTGWMNYNGNRYFFNTTSGRLHIGWLSYRTNRYFLNSSGRMQTGWLTNNGNRYFLNSSGHMQTGWLSNGGNWYFLDPTTGHRQTGWVTHNGNRYFLNTTTGHMHTGWLLYRSNRYFFNQPAGAHGNSSLWPVGAMKTGWIRADDNHQFFLNSSGHKQVGWLTFSGSDYFLNPSSSDRRHDPLVPHGAMRTGRIAIYDRRHQFSSAGRWQGRITGRDPYVHMRAWWPPANSGETVIPIRPWSNAPNNYWTSGMERGLLNWNLSDINVRFVRTEASRNAVIFRDNPTGTYLGRYYWTPPIVSGGNVIEFNIVMNTATITRRVGNDNERLRNYVTSIFTHELAHAVGLEDNPRGVTRQGSIMNTGSNQRNRNYVIGLTPFDRASIWALYD